MPFSTTYPVRVLLVDDHPIVQSGLTYELGKLASLQVIHTATSLGESLQQINNTPIDVVVSDLYLTETTTGIHLLTQLRERGLTLPVLILSSDDRTRTVRQALGAGAAGFVSKRSTPHEIAEAIWWAARQKGAGGTYIAPRDLRTRIEKDTQPDALQQPDTLRALTKKELVTLRAYGQGLEPKEIAHERAVAVTTVYSHLASAREKLGIHHEVELRNFAIRHLLSEVD